VDIKFLSGFSLGAASILTNVCLLPLYPGMIAFLAGNANNPRARTATAWLGVLVLAGILTLMLTFGVVFFLIRREMSVIFPLLLPLIYLVVIGLGMLMLSGRNPFERLATVQTPLLRNPYMMAYVYGLLLAPMTLPCAGPVLTTGLVIAANNGALGEQLAYFLGFGLGFGFPLVLLPLLAMPLQRYFVGFLTQNHIMIARVVGVLLVGIGLFGLYEILPNYFPAAV
jgi:cytochrome c-type biogenesis protein